MRYKKKLSDENRIASEFTDPEQGDKYMSMRGNIIKNLNRAWHEVTPNQYHIIYNIYVHNTHRRWRTGREFDFKDFAEYLKLRLNVFYVNLKVVHEKGMVDRRPTRHHGVEILSLNPVYFGQSLTNYQAEMELKDLKEADKRGRIPSDLITIHDQISKLGTNLVTIRDQSSHDSLPTESLMMTNEVTIDDPKRFEAHKMPQINSPHPLPTPFISPIGEPNKFGQESMGQKKARERTEAIAAMKAINHLIGTDLKMMGK